MNVIIGVIGGLIGLALVAYGIKGKSERQKEVSEWRRRNEDGRPLWWSTSVGESY